MFILDIIKLIKIAFTPGPNNPVKPHRRRKLTPLIWRSHALWFILLLLCMMLLSGCINIYTRCPGTETKISYCYQSTDTAAAMTIVSSFPQAMAAADNRGFEWYNVLTITFLGIPCFVDTVCEAAIDTVLFPVDCIIMQ